MLVRLKEFILENHLIDSEDKLLLTVSGGKDSVAMLHLFACLGYRFSIAHCNFKLRGAESDQDELFVYSLAKKYRVPFYTNHFNTVEYANKHKLSIQMAARKLRYDWFDLILKKYNYSKLLTAHHLDDSVETLILKKSRKTSLEGLRGILPKNGSLIRPLLCFSSQELLAYLKKNKFDFREDSSNRSLNYQRNYIRNKYLPNLEKKNQNIKAELIEEIELNKIKFNQLMADVVKIKSLFFSKFEFGFRLKLDWISKYDNSNEILYHLLKGYGPFNWNDVFDLVNSTNGKWLANHTYRLIKERGCFELAPIFNCEETEYQILENTVEIKALNLLVSKSEIVCSKKLIFDVDSLALDAEKLDFPLIIRRWKKGDKFIPLGMKGGKKISDFLIDKKCSTLQKENTWVICSKDSVAAIVGYRVSDSFKVDKMSKFVLIIRNLNTLDNG